MDARPQVLFDDKGRKVSLGGVPMPRYLEGCTVDVIAGVTRSYAVVYEEAVSAELRANIESLCALSDQVAGMRDLDSVSWPVRPLYADKERVDLVGYTLRKPPATGVPFDVVLENPERHGSRIAVDRRIEVLFTLCLVMNAIHSLGRVMGPLDDRLLVVRDDGDAVGIIHFDWLGTSLVEARDAYLAPEVVADFLSPSSLTKQADHYALAVVIYRMLTNGALPAYGTSGEEQVSPSPVPASFPNYLTEAFEWAFVEGERRLGARPAADDWSRILSRYSKDVRQCTSCGAHWFWRWRVSCPYCAEEAKDTSGDGRADDGAAIAAKMPPEPLAHPMREALGSLECDAGRVIAIEGERYQVLGSCRFRKGLDTENDTSRYASADVGATWCILFLSRLGANGVDAGGGSKHDDDWLLVDRQHGVCELLSPGSARARIALVDEGSCKVVESDGWQPTGMSRFDLFERGVAANGSTTFTLIEKKRRLSGTGDDAHWETIKLYTRLAGHRLDVASMRLEAKQTPSEPVARDAGAGSADGRTEAPVKKTHIAIAIAACAVALLLFVAKGGVTAVSDFLFTPVEEPEPSHVSTFETLYSDDSLPYDRVLVPQFGASTYGSRHRDVDEVVEQVLGSLGDEVLTMARDDESGAVGILTEKKYVFVYPNAGADGDEASDADFTKEDAECLTGSAGDMYEADVHDAEGFSTYVLCCDRRQAYRTDLRPFHASWRAYYWYRAFYRAEGWAADSDGERAASSYEHYTGPTELD